MELQDFVRTTLLEIFRGIREANATFAKEVSDQFTAFRLMPGAEKKEGRGIHFDVAVTTKSERGAGAGAKVSIAVVEARIGGGGQVSNEQASRIQFSVEVGQYLG